MKFIDGTTRGERTGWRDQEISARHRLWGPWAGAIDMDFLLIEATVTGVPKALIEYKHFQAKFATNYQLRVYRELGDKAELPFFLAVYCNKDWWFKVSPHNHHAREILTFEKPMSEYEYIRFLQELRGVHAAIPDTAKRIAPPYVAAKRVS